MSEELGVGSKLGSTSHGNLNSATCWLDGLGKLKKTATETQRSEVKEDREMDHAKEGNFYPWLASCNAGRVTPSPGQLRNPRISICQGSPQPPARKGSSHVQEQLFLHHLVARGWRCGSEGGVIKQETVQTLEAQVGSCSRLDANKRTCILPTHCLPTPPDHISDTQPVVPMERKGTSEQRVHAATHPHTAVLSLLARSQVWVFLFFSRFYFLEKFTLKSTSLPNIHICFIIIETQRVLIEAVVYDTEGRLGLVIIAAAERIFS